jgi:hypothetical protein
VNALGLQGDKKGWNIISSLTLPAGLSTATQQAIMCSADWIYLVVYDVALGRNGRHGHLEAIVDEERTPQGLADICKGSPRQQFAIWWELCNDKETAAANFKKQRAEANELKRGMKYITDQQTSTLRRSQKRKEREQQKQKIASETSQRRW